MVKELKKAFKIDEEFRAMSPALRSGEAEQLERHLKRDGCREPLAVWRGEDILLDGHQRFEICSWHDIPFDVAYQEFETRDDAKEWIITNQLGRRNLCRYAKTVMALELEGIFEARAQLNRGRRTDLFQDSEEGYQPVDTLREIAKIAGVSHDTVAKVKRIQQEAAPEIKVLLREEEISIHAADIVAKLPHDKQVDLAIQGGDAVQKAAVQMKQEAKRQEEDRLWDEAKNATPEPPEDPEAETQRQTFREQCQQEFGTALGQTWEIRSLTITHYLFVGDATSENHMDTLMGGKLADIIVVDPPYNVGYVGKTEEALNYGKDNMTPEEFQEFIRQASDNLWKHAKPGAAMYMWHADGGCVEVRLGVKDAGWNTCKANVVWVKQKPSQSWFGYNAQHEPCLVAWKPGSERNWFGGHDKNTTWYVKKPTANREHPTPKPTELYKKSLLHASRKGDIVVDTFCGSGTAIEAAHRTGRICYAMEKDPGYAAVILKRMQRLGLELKLITGAC